MSPEPTAVHSSSLTPDILGGHNKVYGDDVNDTLHGDADDDVILGDNGEIVRQIVEGPQEAEFPWVVHAWKHYAEPFDNEVIRDLRRYDDIDLVQGEIPLLFVGTSGCRGIA